MRISRQHSLIIALALLVSSIAFAAFSPTNPDQISLGVGVTAPASGNVDLPPDSGTPVLSPNADIILFTSAASNLIEGDTNGHTDIFISRNGGALSRASLGRDAFGNDTEPDNDSDEPAISPVLQDGNYAIAFTSQATNLVPELIPPGFEGSPPKQVYVRIPRLGKVILVSSALPGGNIGFGNADSTHPSITAVVEPQGTRYIVTFATYASNIAPDTTAQAPEPLPYSRIVVAIIDGKSGEVLAKNLLLPVDSAGNIIEPLGNLKAPVVNGQGDSIVFLTDATNLGWTPLSASPTDQVVLARKRKPSTVVFPSPPPPGDGQPPAGTSPTSPPRFPTDLTLISKVNTPDEGGIRAPGAYPSFEPVISFSGDFIAFATLASNISGRTSSSLALWERSTDQLSLVNSDRNGNVPEDSYPQHYALRRNGRLILFTDSSSSLTDDGDTNDVTDLFAKDLVDGQIVRLNKRLNPETGLYEQSDHSVTALTIGAAGYNVDRSTIAFASAGNLVTVGDTTVSNIFRLNLRYPPPPLVSGAPLQSPPDVTVRGSTCTLILQRFSSVSVSSASANDEDPVSALGSKVTYDVRLKNLSTRKTTTRTSTSVRLTIRNLKPGTYSVKYRAQGKKGRRTISTKFSPSVSVTIKR